MSRKIKISVVVLLAVTFLLPFLSAQTFSAASDEITHLPSGYSYWKTGLVQLNLQHPPLVKLLSAFPLLFLDVEFSRQDPALTGPLKDEWQFGWNLLFANQADQLLFWGRLPVMLLSVLLGFYIFKWASEMFNPKGGLLALFLYTFMPAIIANAQFVTTDLAVTAFSFITLYYLWKFFRTEKKRDLLATGLFLGLALGSKFSAVLLFPVLFLLILIQLWPKTGNWESKVSQALKWVLMLGGLSAAVIWVIYLLPLDFSFYLRGLKTVYADWIKNPRFYLNGHFSSDGWWYYFLLAFLIKTPLPALIAFAAALLFYKKYKLSWRDSAFIFVPILIFGVVTSLKAGNIGLRYLLPVYPFLMLWSGGLAKIIPFKGSTLPARAPSPKALAACDHSLDEGGDLKKGRTLVILVLAGWYVFSAFSIYPDYLAYFNELVGGSKNGYKYLDDSNVEWGQDLKRLSEYQKKYPEMKVLYSWDFTNPDYYGIKNVLPKKPESFLNPSGRYAVNTHFLIRLQELSQRFNDPNLNWLSLYQPVDRIGYSFFIYEF